jgi:hypothetical protein
MSAREEQANAVMQVFSTGQKLTGRELQILRENAQLLEGHDAKTDYYLFRMQIELIDAIRDWTRRVQSSLRKPTG